METYVFKHGTCVAVVESTPQKPFPELDYVVSAKEFGIDELEHLIVYQNKLWAIKPEDDCVGQY